MRIEGLIRRLRRRGGVASLAAALSVVALGLGLAGAAGALERRLAGSAQLDYLLVPTQMQARDITFDGFTTELSLKLAVDINEHLSASVKVCSSCHGLETGVAAIDVALGDSMSLRVGRFTPRFGDFPARHDPANHRTSDKPLPYDMGRMLQLRAWNMSVLPAPNVDNGVELSGRHSLGTGTEVDWALYVVGGMRTSDGGVDLDFLQSRSAKRYYVDNNSSPSVGGRLSLSRLGTDSELRLGASAVYGTADPSRQLDYLILGADLVLQRGETTLRAEYLLRRQRMGFGPDPRSQFIYGPNSTGGWSTYFVKDGFYVEVERGFGRVEGVVRFDGMTRYGNVPVGSEIDARAWIVRSTAAVAVRVFDRLRIKGSVEWYRFSDFDDQLAMHIGLVTAF